MMILNKSKLSEVREEYPIYGNPSSYYGMSFVAFIDLLGFSSNVSKNWNEGQNGALQKLLRIKQAIPKENELGRFCLTDNNGKRLFEYRVKIKTISDSIIIYMAIDKEMTFEHHFMSLSQILFSTWAVWRQAIIEGFTIRGSIAKGQVYWDENEIIGPAFNRAYEMEGIADSSRVLIDPRIIKDFTKYSKQKIDIYHPYSMLNFFNKNDDCKISLSPKNIVNNEVKKEDMIELIERMSNEKGLSEKIRGKYNELLKNLKNEESIKIPTIENMKYYLSLSDVKKIAT